MRPKARSLGMIAGIALLVALVVGLVSAPEALAAKGGNKARADLTIQATVVAGGLMGNDGNYWGTWSAEGAISDSGNGGGGLPPLELFGTSWHIYITWDTSNAGRFVATRLDGSEILTGTGSVSCNWPRKLRPACQVIFEGYLDEEPPDFVIQAGLSAWQDGSAGPSDWSSIGAITDSGTCEPYYTHTLTLHGTYWDVVIDWAPTFNGLPIIVTTGFRATQIETGQQVVGTGKLSVSLSTMGVSGDPYIVLRTWNISFEGYIDQ
jgi:hypothetical protein